MGEPLTNPYTGEIVEVLSDSGDELVMDVQWTRPGHRAPRHAHPGMEETWEVLAGRACFDVDGTVTAAGPGDTVVAPKGAWHEAFNDGDEPVHLRVTMRPALRWAAFVDGLFRALAAGDGEAARALVDTHPDEISI